VPTMGAYDPENTLLAEGPAALATTPLPPQPGVAPRMAVTIRTSSATLTVILDKRSGLAWGEQVSDTARNLPGPVPPAPHGNGRLHVAGEHG